MSLSTQLHRGTLALPMLLLFAVLALVANGEAGAKPPTDTAPAAAFAHATASIEAPACMHPGLMLGNAPADLAPLAQHAGDCHA